ncbi:MAG: glycosyltransferase [Alphaproteobacteria bacterium]|nr:glycosyltransferase [Alphaproteobacteria bacterium]
MPNRIAVLLPCHNEEVAIEDVVRAFRAALPDAAIYVYDNNSTDGTAARAAGAGAVVRHESLRGKGNVVRRMFADVDADIYVMCDGDGTYDAAAAPAMIARLAAERLDMVVCARIADADAAYRTGHRFGNFTLTAVVGRLFGSRFTDMLSGYRAFSRRFVKSFPALASGFEIETELTVHALELKMPVGEIEAPYASRPEGSASKLSTWSDGLRILAAILFLFKEVRPFRFFGAMSLLLALAGIILAYPLVATYLATGLVPRLPTAVLVTGIMLLASMALVCGIILDTVSRGRREAKRLRYLALNPVRNETDPG